MDSYIRAKEILANTVAVAELVLPTNAAYLIYRDLHDKFLLYDNFDAFFDNNKATHDLTTKFLDHVHQCSNFDPADKKSSYHNLGDHISNLLPGRFVKEKSQDPNVTRDEHIINWFRQNSLLDMELDSCIIQAAYITLFLI